MAALPLTFIINSTSLWLNSAGTSDPHRTEMLYRTRLPNITIVEDSILSPSSIKRTADKLSVVFPDRSNRSWITPQRARGGDGKWNGLLFVKVPKCASSTVAGVILRIARQYAPLRAEVEHQLPSLKRFGNRSPSSYLVATVREPARRVVSAIVYFKSRERQHVNKNVVDEYVQNAYTRGLSRDDGRSGGTLLHWMELEPPPHTQRAWSNATPNVVIDPEFIQRNVQLTLSKYDFVLIVERLDESLVAMALSMGIPVTDVLYGIPSKQQTGGYFWSPPKPRHGRGKKTRKALPSCVPVQSIPYNTQSLAAASWWRAMNYGDYLLYATVHASLNRTIARLGEERFHHHLREYRAWKEQVALVCHDQVYPPCSSTGKLQLQKAESDCYRKDFGCGYPCVDLVVSAGFPGTNEDNA